MKNNEKKILHAIGDVDDKYLEQAKPRGRAARLPLYRGIAIAASFVLVVGIVLGAMIMGMGNPQNVIPPAAEKPFPEVPKPSKSLAAVMEEYLESDYGSNDIYPEGGFDDGMDVLPEEGVGGGDNTDSSGSNGSYVEVTDNQVAGIIEGDLYKTTDKYIFRYFNRSLYIYSIDGENSKKISVTPMNSNGNKNYADMFLSADGNTVTIVQSEYVTEIYEYENYTWYSGYYITRIYSIDVSDVKNPVITKTLELSGSNRAARKIGDKIYLVTSHSFNKAEIDLDDPQTYIPSISGDNTHLCDLERIYYCDEIKNATYSYVTVFDEDDLSLVSELAILSEVASYMTDVFFTDNHIIFEYQSGKKISEEESTSEAYSRIELIDFSGEGLRYRGSLEIKGWAEVGQYSYDEQDGYLRVVTSTRLWKRYWVEKSSASLYVYDLSTMSLVASVENFAPEGERATAVRFEGDKLYVCTAETAKFTDPVFFFDLSDYENITEVNTGYIEGFSSSLIDLGEGYLLGIGRESRSHMKIEIYKREGGSVVSVAKQVFRGNYYTDYHAYLIDREKNLFGLAVNYIKEGYGVSYGHGYFLWYFDTDTESLSLLTEISGDTANTPFSHARAFVRDGYLYLTSVNEFAPLVVRKVEVK